MSKKIDAIVTAIGQLDPNDRSLWTADGKPNVVLLTGMIPGKPYVSAAERDHAWDIYQKNLPAPAVDNAAEADSKNNHDDAAGTTTEGKEPDDNDAPTGAGLIAGGTYEVLSPLQYNGKRYEPGEPVELSAEDAAPLMPGTVKPWKK